MEATAIPDLCDGMECGTFLMTTVVPIVIMVLVNYGILHHKMRLSPLKFLRRDLSGKKQKQCSFFKSEDEDFYQIQISCDLSEYQ